MPCDPFWRPAICPNLDYDAQLGEDVPVSAARRGGRDNNEQAKQ